MRSDQKEIDRRILQEMRCGSHTNAERMRADGVPESEVMKYLAIGERNVMVMALGRPFTGLELEVQQEIGGDTMFVSAKVNGQRVKLEDPKLGFPSETLIAQLRLLA